MIAFLYGVLIGFVVSNFFAYFVEVYNERQEHSRIDK
jgi:hypothetical protein